VSRIVLDAGDALPTAVTARTAARIRITELTVRPIGGTTSIIRGDF
jgi:hypothetical protein